WPKYDTSFLVEDIVTVVIQVNGKVRSKIDVPAEICEDELMNLILADERLKPWVQNQPIEKFIVVPKKLVNIVI
ncbi:MAG: hypothetical protein V2A64_04235, partial [Candidatus Omnitrophota bacterium]